MDPKRHHIISKFLLKNFTDRDGLVYFFDRTKPRLGVKATSPINVAVEKHYYSEQDKSGQRDNTAEKQLAEIEAEAAPIVARTIEWARHRQDKNFPISLADRAVLDRFLYFQMKRSPEAFAQIWATTDPDEERKSFLREFEETIRPLTEGERAQFQDPASIRRMEKNIRVRVMSATSSVTDDVLRLVGAMRLSIVVTKRNFVVGTRSVAKFHDAGRPHLQDPGTLLYMPVAKDVALLLSNDQRRPHLSVVDGMETVRDLNAEVFRLSNLIVSAEPALLESLAAPR